MYVWEYDSLAALYFPFRIGAEYLNFLSDLLGREEGKICKQR